MIWVAVKVTILISHDSFRFVMHDTWTKYNATTWRIIILVSSITILVWSITIHLEIQIIGVSIRIILVERIRSSQKGRQNSLDQKTDKTGANKRELTEKHSAHNIALKTKARVTRTLQKIGRVHVLQKGKQLLLHLRNSACFSVTKPLYSHNRCYSQRISCHDWNIYCHLKNG